MPTETMTGRERWLAVLRRETPDRIPMDYWGTEEASAKLAKHLGCADLDEALTKLHVDRPLEVAGRYIGPPLPEGTNPFGLEYTVATYDGGEYLEAGNRPLEQYESVAEIEADYTWPSPDWWDYSHIKAEIEANPTRPIRGGLSEPFLMYCMLRGLEQAFADLIENPDIVHYCLGKMFDLAYTDATRIYEAAGEGNIQITYVAEDMGSQESLMFSPTQIKEFFIPGMTRMIELAHQAGAYVFHHNDGGIRKIIPTMIEAGIDVLNPIQWKCAGMEREGLKRDFGDQLIFHGAVDNQYTLPFGSVDEVRQEVIDNIRILGEGGGYILAPCHNIQVVGPAENIVAMYETGYEHGWT
jgi:uroporphyrinogen decarboxylase